MKLYILLLALVTVTLSNDLSNCKCQIGFVAKEDENGEAKCFGILVKAILPCNLPKKPKCVCGPETTGIIHDGLGTWCSIYNQGREVRKWKCENQEDWNKFYERHPEQRK